MKQLQIGWGRVKWTPSARCNLCGQFQMRPSEGVLDDVYITALVLSESPDDAVILVSCECVGIGENTCRRIREMLAERAPEVPQKKMIVTVTHTHTAPDITGTWGFELPELMKPSETSEHFAGCVMEAVRQAWAARQPGAVSWGFGFAVLSHQRRTRYFPGSVAPQHLGGMKTEKNATMYGSTNRENFAGFDGYEDHTLQTLFTFDAAGKATGAVVNIPCPSQETEGMSVISADFWHEARLELEAHFGASFKVLGLCAAAGDLSPHTLYLQKAEERMLELRHVSRRQELARRMAQEVIMQFDVVKNSAVSDPVLDGMMVTIELPRRLVTTEEAEAVRAALAELEAIPPSASDNPEERLCEDSTRYSKMQRCHFVLRRYQEQRQSPTLTSEVVALRIGDVGIVSNPFELFCDYGIRIQAQSPALQTMTVQLTATPYVDNMAYLATERALEGESYSANIYCNSVSAEGGQVLVRESLTALNKLFEK